MTSKLRVIQYGLGPIGRAIARHLLERKGYELVGGIDIDPNIGDRDISFALGLDAPTGIKVYRTLKDALLSVEADVVIHATSSYFPSFKDQILEILEAKLNVVSTAEELTFPWLSHREQAREIDAKAQQVGKSVLGTGVNPGFIMDTLPLTLTAICQVVNRIDVKRVINASTRRGPFQKKIGAGMTVDHFNQEMNAGRMGHVGLFESVSMIFDTLNKELISYETEVEPIVADHPLKTDYFFVETGQVSGLKQTAHAFSPHGEFVKLTFVAALEAEDDYDQIQIHGRPNLDVKMHGTNGDIATVAIVVNAARRIRMATPGLLTMRDLPMIAAS